MTDDEFLHAIREREPNQYTFLNELGVPVSVLLTVAERDHLLALLAAKDAALQVVVDRLIHVCGNGSANVDDALRAAQKALGQTPIPPNYRHVDW